MSKTEFSYHTHDPRYGQKSAASSKNGKFFVTDIFLFHFAAKPSENNEKMSKTEFFYHTHETRDMDKKVLPAVKMGIFCHRLFLVFILLENHLKMMKNFENRILLSHP